MKNNQVIFILLLLISSLGLSAELTTEVSGNYPLELMKHYIAQQEYDLALQVINDYPQEVEKADSLAWLAAFVYKIRQEYNNAAYNYAQVTALSQDSLLIKDSAENLIRIVPFLSPRPAIDLLVEAVKNVSTNDSYLILIMKLAELYESSYLYSEANDIYTTLLESDLEIDETSLYIKVATNKVYEKKYEEAVFFADKAEAVKDSLYSAEALFIQFLSYQALGNDEQALPALLRLYLNFPSFNSIFEINLSLAELLAGADEKLAAWYVLERYFPSANQLEQKLIIEQIRSLKDSIEISADNMFLFDNIEFDFTPLLGDE